MKPKCSCIIPFYNEKNRVDKVLRAISRIREIDQVICVDDGSTDGGQSGLARISKKIKVIRHRKNLGKAEAIRSGIKKTGAGLVFLCDADLSGLENVPFGKIIRLMKNNQSPAMVIIAGKPVYPGSMLTRSHLVFSGQRILWKTDLAKIMKGNPSQFQLEIAINDYMIENKRLVYYIPSEISHPAKPVKYGFAEGLYRDLLMVADEIGYHPIKYYYQSIFFAREKLESPKND